MIFSKFNALCNNKSIFYIPAKKALLKAEPFECFLSVLPYSSIGKHTTIVRLHAAPLLETSQRINV